MSKSNDRGNSSVVVTANLEDGKTATYVSETTVSSTQQNQQNKPNSSGGSTTTTVNNSTQFTGYREVPSAVRERQNISISVCH